MPKAKSRNKSLNTLTPSKSNDDVLSQAAAEAPALSQYEEQQNDEIEVLRSIFPEDFEQIETRTAWSKKSEKSFRLKLSAESDTALSTDMTVTFTATYPKTTPLLSLAGSNSSVPARTKEKIEHLVASRPRELAGEVMILEISNEIRDVLEDAALTIAEGRAVPSLEVERAHREAEAERLAQVDLEREATRAAHEKQEEERAMEQLVEDEIRRRDALRQKRQPISSRAIEADNLQPSDILFDHPISIDYAERAALTFQAVSVVKSLTKSSVSETMEVRALTQENCSNSNSAPHFILKRLSVPQSHARKSILDLEDDLERLKTMSNENLVNVVSFKMSHINRGWQFDILQEKAEASCLQDVLDVAQYMPVSSVRAYAIDVLQGLSFLHKNGIAHGALNATNVFICGDSASKVVKLANCAIDGRVSEIADEQSNTTQSIRSPAWVSKWKSPELQSRQAGESTTSKKDIWDFGVLTIQMIMGANILEKCQPSSLQNNAELTTPYRDLLRDALRVDPRRRPSAFDLIPYEFLRTSCEAIQQSQGGTVVSATRRRQSSHQQESLGDAKFATLVSRYASEWFEVGRLGKGGYGEVIKARNKLDGRVYAVKKIVGKTQSQLSEVLSEVYMLATLNHPYVVRYYTAWPEDERDQMPLGGRSEQDSFALDVTESSSLTSELSQPDLGPSTGGIDFISSSGYPKIDFGHTDESETDSDGDDSNDDDSIFGRPASSPEDSPKIRQTTPPPTPKTAAKATLYIQMEFCEKLTLRDIIRRGIHTDKHETWRLLRQILEGLAHIHSHGIIHRDLKPENIFIDFGNNPKIGDFGLATTGQRTQRQNHSSSSQTNPTGDMTLSVGTALYVAPELRSSGSGNYTDKVDMYSLGIITFEMCHPLSTAMERGQVLSQLRQREHSLPDVFQSPEKLLQAEVILSLIQHKPTQRPSSLDLLRGGKIPVRIEDEQMRQALSSLSDPSSPFFNSMMEALFSQTVSSNLQDRLWEQNRDSVAVSDATDYFSLQGLVKEHMVKIFRRYGAIEAPRHVVFPQSEYYSKGDVSHFLDATGVAVQLAYDLILPHARMIARQSHIAARSFAFGTVYRASAGGAPRSNREADFDIVSRAGEDTTLAEAEVIKCLDDLVLEFPCFNSTPICIHLSHASLLDAILDLCRIPHELQSRAKDVIGKLHMGPWTWQKIRAELRAPALGIASSSIDEMAQFDFREVPEKAFKKLQDIFKNSQYLAVVHEVFTRVSGLVEYLKRFGLRRKVYFSPLSNVNEKFYKSNIMFQCVFDTKKRDILAAGGRYDSLIREQQPQHLKMTTQFCAVGTNIAWDRIVASMARTQQKSASKSYLKTSEVPANLSHWTTRQRDVLIASLDPKTLRSTGIKLVTELRAYNIKAELAIDARTPDDLIAYYRSDRHCWLAIIKHEGLASGKPDLKVRRLDGKGESTDVQSSELINFMRAEFREREEQEGHSSRATKLLRQPSQPDAADTENQADVHLLIATHRTKKTNKARVIADAQQRVKDLLAGYGEGPIAAVETRDEYLEKIRDTRLSDLDTWRKVIQNVPLSERKYCHDLLDLLESFKGQYGESTRKCFIYNFRTGYCFDYDLCL